jgi:hypothetical protein
MHGTMRGVGLEPVLTQWHQGTSEADRAMVAMVVVATAAAAVVLAGMGVVSAKLTMTETETDPATVMSAANTRGTRTIGMLHAKRGTGIPVTESPAGTRGMIAAAAVVAGPSGAATEVQEQEQEGCWVRVAVASASA